MPQQGSMKAAERMKAPFYTCGIQDWMDAGSGNASWREAWSGWELVL